MASDWLWSVIAMYDEPGRRAPRAPWSRRRRGRRWRSCACAGRRADRRAATRRGQRAALGGFDLAAVLAQLGRHERQAERVVDVLLRSRPPPAAPSSMRYRPYSFSLKPALDGAVAQRDVVRLRAGEVLQRGAEALARHEAQVGLEPAAQQHARLGFAVREDALDEAVAGEGVHQRRRCAGGEDVEIAARLAAAAQAADRRRCRRRARARAASRPGPRRYRALRPSAGGRRRGARSSSALRIQRLLLRAHALERRAAGRRAPRASRSSSVRMPSSR